MKFHKDVTKDHIILSDNDEIDWAECTQNNPMTGFSGFYHIEQFPTTSWWRLQWNICSYPTQSITAHLIHCCSMWRCQNWSGGCQGSVPPWRFGRGNFMNPPEGFPLTVYGHVWKLKKSIYGLKQATHMCKAVHELTCESLGLIFPWFRVQLELFPMVPSQIKSRNHTDSFILLPKYNPYKQYLLWLGAMGKIQIRLGFVSHKWFSQITWNDWDSWTALHMWYQKLRNTLETLRYGCTTSDHAVFVH